MRFITSESSEQAALKRGFTVTHRGFRLWIPLYGFSRYGKLFDLVRSGYNAIRG